MSGCRVKRLGVTSTAGTTEGGCAGAKARGRFEVVCRRRELPGRLNWMVLGRNLYEGRANG